MNRRPTQSRSGYDSFSPRHTANFTAASPDMHFFEARRRRSLSNRALLGVCAALVMLLLINFTVNQFVHIERISVPVKGLDEVFDGYTILQISDLKGALFSGDQSLIRFALQNEDFDAVVLTGDMVSAMGNAQPLYALIDVLHALKPDSPIYFIAGDDDPTPTSMDYATGGSPFAPWVLGAQQRGAELLSSPQAVTRGEQSLWFTTIAQLNLDMDTMQRQFEQQYLRALDGGDDNELELSKHNLQSLENTRAARKAIREEDVLITLSHVPPAEDELTSASPSSLVGQIDLLLGGHYLGGLLRLPLLGPVFIPSQSLPHYGLFPGSDLCSGLRRVGSTWVYISPGLGSQDSRYPFFFFRLANPPTVTLLSLTPSSM